MEIASYSEISDMYNMFFVSKNVSHAARAFFEKTFGGNILLYVRTIDGDSVFLKRSVALTAQEVISSLERWSCKVAQCRPEDASILSLHEFGARNKLIVENNVYSGSWKTSNVTRIKYMRYSANGDSLPEIVYHGFYNKKSGVCFLVGDPKQPSATVFTSGVKFHNGSLWSMTLIDGNVHWFAARSFDSEYKLTQDYIIIEDEMIYVTALNKFYKFSCKKISSILEMPADRRRLKSMV
jgi:hypothetical protein